MTRTKRAQTEEVAITQAVGYIRVSTEEQANSGLGLEAQSARIKAYCIAQGWELIALHTDAGISAKTLNRPGLKAALDALAPGRILLALKLDRLTRTARDLDDFTAQVQKQNGQWATVEGQYDTSTAMGAFMLRLVADIAQLEREQTAERTSAALQAKKVRKERLGATPLGYKTIDTPEGKRVIVDPEEAKTVQLARDLYNSGLSLRKIAAQLTAAGRKTKRGGLWYASNVSCLMYDRYLEEIGV